MQNTRRSAGCKERRWCQFSTRALFLGLVVLCAALAWGASIRESARHQQQLVAEITKNGGEVYFDFQITPSGGVRPSNTPPDPKWLRNLLGEHAFASVGWVVYQGQPVGDEEVKRLRGFRELTALNLKRTRVTDECLEYLIGMKRLRHLYLDGTRVTDEGVQRLQVALPNCQIFRSSGTTQRLSEWKTKVTEKGAAAFKEKLPGVTVNMQ